MIHFVKDMFRHAGHSRHAPILRAVIPLVLLATLLVGSCRVSDLPEAYGLIDDRDAPYTLALFPDFLIWKRDHASKDLEAYQPAAGYIHAAKNYISHSLDSVLSLSAHDINMILGTPEIKRLEHEAEIWQYSHKECVLNIYFYDAQATYIDLIKLSDDQTTMATYQDADQKCIERITKSRRA